MRNLLNHFVPQVAIGFATLVFLACGMKIAAYKVEKEIKKARENPANHYTIQITPIGVFAYQGSMPTIWDIAPAKKPEELVPDQGLTLSDNFLFDVQ